MIPVYHLVKPNATPARETAERSSHSAARAHKISELPADPLCYVVTGGGIYKQIRNEFYTAHVKADKVGHLAELHETVELHLPKLPLDILRRAEAFFLAAYEKFRSEAVVLLFANSKTGEWRMEVPAQRVPGFGLHVEYDPTSVAAPAGFLPFGTIHSHAVCAAFHSGTDDKDEAHADGLHITVGNLDKPERTYAARWMIQGRPFPAKLSDAVAMPDLPAPNPAWIERIDVAERKAGTVHGESRSDSWPQDREGSFWPPEEDLECAFETAAEYEEYLRETYGYEHEEYPIGMESF